MVNRSSFPGIARVTDAGVGPFERRGLPCVAPQGGLGIAVGGQIAGLRLLAGAPGLLGVALSGAGPSLIAFVRGAPQPTVAALEQVYRDLRLAAEVRPVKVDTAGAIVIDH